jgi:hypothetical protein
MKQQGDYRRWLYRGGRPNWFARVQDRATALAFAAGIAGRRGAALQIRGRRTGRIITFPVAIADYEGERYLVSMLGEDVNWVRNLRAADGHAVPGARPHIPVSPGAPIADFERISADFPVFRIRADAA